MRIKPQEFYRDLQVLFRKSIRKLFQFVLRKNLDIKNTHAGDTCYLICDGGSLKYFDLSKFGDYKSLVSSAVPLHKEFQFLDPLYYVQPEPFLYWPSVRKGRFVSLAARRKLQQIYSPFRLNSLGTSSILSLTNWPFTFSSQSLYFMDDFYDKELSDHFITKQVDGFSGTLSTMISYAIYMGFTRAYLIGCDYTQVPSKSGHWYETGIDVETDQSNYLKEFLTLASEEIELITVTPNSTIKGLYIKHITYSELTGCQPMFRENYELMDEENLRILRMQSQYKV